jgi:hypothetical protein
MSYSRYVGRAAKDYLAWHGSIEIPGPKHVQHKTGRGHGDDILAHIADQLDRGMLRSEEPGKTFICEHAVRNIWSNRNDIKDLLNGGQWDDNEIKLIQRHFIKILSILILIGSDALLNPYCKRYLRNPEFTDRKLPFDEEKLLKFLDSRSAPRFQEHQYKFIPVLIEEDSLDNHQEIPPQFRLPFVSERSEIGRGGCGIIDEVCVAPGYLTSRNGSSNWPNVSSPTPSCYISVYIRHSPGDLP